MHKHITHKSHYSLAVLQLNPIDKLNKQVTLVAVCVSIYVALT